jgi:hypothetical protein
LDHYQDPRLLSCSHTFCFECIQKAVINGSFNCPFQDNTRIDQNNITQLPINRTAKDMVEFILSINLPTDKKSSQQCDNCDNQAVNWCDKCASHLCQSCAASVHSIKILQSHTIVPLVEKVQSFCLDHSDEKFKYWCKKCEVLICRDCLFFQHKDHPFASLKEAASDAKANFQNTAQEINDIKQNLTTLSETTKGIITQRQETVRRERQDIEETFTNLQRMLEARKLEMIRQLEENELQTMNSLEGQQNTIDQHLNLTIVQEHCIKKMLDSNDPMQILNFKSTLGHNYKHFIEQYKKIDEGYTIANHKFEKDDQDLQQIIAIISKLGRINSKSQLVERDSTRMNIILLDISKPDGETKFTGKALNWARGYKFSLKQPLHLHSICIQSDYMGKHVGFVVNDANVIISNGTVNSNDSTMKWLTIPLKCDIMDDYTVFVWASSGNGSYAYKEGDKDLRKINQNCSVESKAVEVPPQTSVGSKVTISVNIYSIDMVLNIVE